MMLCKASSAHGTVDSNTLNQNIEMRMTIKKDSVDWGRWMNDYLIDPSLYYRDK